MEGRIIDAVDLEGPGTDQGLRPTEFDEYIGQARVKENLRIFVEAARRATRPPRRRASPRHPQPWARSEAACPC